MSVDNKVKGIVVVHGIGKQQPLASVQRLITQLAKVHGHDFVIPLGDIAKQIRPNGISGSLGYDNIGWATFEQLPGYAFSEVHWADIAELYAESVVPPLTEWLNSIPKQISYIDHSKYKGNGLNQSQILFASNIFQDIVLSVKLMRFFLGRYRIETDELIEFIKYFVGSLLVYSEFPDLRVKIMERVGGTMSVLSDKAADIGIDEINVFAHSLGTVICMLCFIRSRNDYWVSRIKTFCTIGSPLDLFIPIWKNIWDEMLARYDEGIISARSKNIYIKWLNFVDDGDPIASTLDLTRDLLSKNISGLFEEKAPLDIRFNSRSWPGKAHLAYWDNVELFSNWVGYMSEKEEYPIRKDRMRKDRDNREKDTLGTNYGHPWVFLLPLIFSLITGWLVIFWFEAGFGSTPINRFATFGLGMLVGLQILCQVIAGSVFSVSRKMSRVIEGLLALLLTILLSIAGYALLYSDIVKPSFGWFACYNKLSDSAYDLDFTTNCFAGWSIFLIVLSIIQLLFNFTYKKRGRWPVIVLLCLLSVFMAVLPWRLNSLQDIANDILRLVLIFTAWWLSLLSWRFYVVWCEYVSGRSHIDWLRGRWFNEL